MCLTEKNTIKFNKVRKTMKILKFKSEMVRIYNVGYAKL